MVFEVLNYLKLRLNLFLSDGRTTADPLIVLSNPWTKNDSNGASFVNAISLINIEEDKTVKSQIPSVPYRDPSRTMYSTREPELRLNLYVMVSSYNKSYEDALKLISRVVSYFQSNNVFASTNDDDNDFPAGVERIMIELFTVGFEQQNQIWASLSTAYIPSVIYKVRMMTTDLDEASRVHKAISTIENQK